jgi:hypothetical protein
MKSVKFRDSSIKSIKEKAPLDAQQQKPFMKKAGRQSNTSRLEKPACDAKNLLEKPDSKEGQRNGVDKKN